MRHPGPDSVVVEVRTASINPVDWKARQGYLEGHIDTVFPAVPLVALTALRSVRGKIVITP